MSNSEKKEEKIEEPAGDSSNVAQWECSTDNINETDSKDKLNVSNYSSNILRESLLSNDSRNNSGSVLFSADTNEAKDFDDLVPPKEDDEYDLHRHRNLNTNTGNSFSNSSLLANYGDSDLYPLGSSKPNLNTPFPNISGENSNNPVFDPLGTRNSSSSNIGNSGGGMIFDPFKNKKEDNENKPGYSGYPGAKYDYPFGNLGSGSGNNGGSGFI